jgi:hypothetical protein
VKKVSFVVVAMLSLSGCTIDALLGLLGVEVPERECGPDEGSQGTMTAKIGGNDFESCITTMTGAPDSSWVITGLGKELVPTQIVLTLSGAAEPGEYKLGGETADGDDNGVVINGEELVTAGSGNEEQASYKTKQDVESGTVTFSELTATHLVGTFTFTATNQPDDGKTLEVTDGAFDVTTDAAGAEGEGEGEAETDGGA